MPHFSSYAPPLSDNRESENHDISNPQEQEIWFDTVDWVEMDDTWFDASDAPHNEPASDAADSLIPFTEDFLRSTRQLISMLGEYKENELISVCLTKILPGTPVSIVMAANSLYTAITERKDIDLAALHTLGLASWLLPDSINVISPLAAFIRETIIGWTEDIFLRQWPGGEENAVSGSLLIALSITLIVANHRMKDEGAPQRAILKVPAFMANIFIRAGCYWRALGNIAGHSSVAGTGAASGPERQKPAFEVDTTIEISRDMCDNPASCPPPSTPQITAFFSNSTVNPDVLTRATVHNRPASASRESDRLPVSEQAHFLAVDKLRQESELSDLLYCATRKTGTRQRAGEKVITETYFNTKCDATEYQYPLPLSIEDGNRAIHAEIRERPLSSAAAGQSGGDVLLPLVATAAAVPVVTSYRQALKSKTVVAAGSVAALAGLSVGGKLLWDKFASGNTGKDGESHVKGNTTERADKIIQSDYLNIPEEVHKKQTKHLAILLESNGMKQEGHKSHNIVNNLIVYLSNGDKNKKMRKVIKCLLEPLNIFIPKYKSITTDNLRRQVLTDYLSVYILGADLDGWFMKQLSDIKLTNEASPSSKILSDKFEEAIKTHLSKGLLCKDTIDYYKKIVSYEIPVLLPEYMGEAGKDMMHVDITDPQWGVVYAGTLSLRDNNIDISTLSLEKIEEAGITLSELMRIDVISEEYNRYFRVPVLSYSLWNGSSIFALSNVSDKDIQKNYKNYHSYINGWVVENNPYLKVTDLIGKWKTRREISTNILREHNIEGYVETYLNVHDKWKFRKIKSIETDFMGYDDIVFEDDFILLPNVDEIFDKQNKEIAGVIYNLDKLTLPPLFELSLDDDNKKFIQNAKVELTSANLHNTVPGKNINISNDIINNIPEKVDFLLCTSGGSARFYSIYNEKNSTKYIINRTDENRTPEDDIKMADIGKKLIEARNAGLVYQSEYFKMIKKEGENLDVLIENLAQEHSTRMKNYLHEKGYDKTTQEQVGEILLSFIPFYSCISESIKGNTGHALMSCSMDILSFLPFAASAARVAGRYGHALTSAGATAIRYGARQATISAMLKQAGREFIKSAPLIAREISPGTIKGLGVSFLRALDPGGELIALGSYRSVRSLRRLIQKIPDAGPGIKQLYVAMSNRVFTHTDVSKIKRKYYPGDGPGLGREIDVVNVGVNNGRKIWVEFNPMLNAPFGQKYISNEGDIIRIAPKAHRSKMPKKQGPGAVTKGEERFPLLAGLHDASDNILYHEAIQRTAKKYGVIIGVRFPNPLGATLLKEGYPSKNFHLKAKSSSTGPTAGFIAENPRYSKISPDNYEKQSKAIEEAMKKGAESVQLTLSKSRIQELIDTGKISHLQSDSYSATYPGGRETFHIDKNGAIFDDKHRPVKVITNPPEAGMSFKNPEPVTADYDLFCIIPRKQQDYNLNPVKLRPVLINGKFELTSPKGKNIGSKGMDKNKGNINFFTETIINDLNKEVHIEGYQGGKLFWHGDESMNPFSPGLDMDDKPFFFLPSGQVTQVHTREQLKKLYSIFKENGFYAEFSPIFNLNSLNIKKISMEEKVINKLSIPAKSYIAASLENNIFIVRDKYNNKLQCIEMNGNFLPFRTNDKIKNLFEVYDIHDKSKPGYPIYVNDKDQWTFGIFAGISDEKIIGSTLCNNIADNLSGVPLMQKDLYPVNSRNIVENDRGESFMKIQKNFFRMVPNPFYKGHYIIGEPGGNHLYCKYDSVTDKYVIVEHYERKNGFDKNKYQNPASPGSDEFDSESSFISDSDYSDIMLQGPQSPVPDFSLVWQPSLRNVFPDIPAGDYKELIGRDGAIYNFPVGPMKAFHATFSPKTMTENIYKFNIRQYLGGAFGDDNFIISSCENIINSEMENMRVLGGRIIHSTRIAMEQSERLVALFGRASSRYRVHDYLKKLLGIDDDAVINEATNFIEIAVNKNHEILRNSVENSFKNIYIYAARQPERILERDEVVGVNAFTYSEDPENRIHFNADSMADSYVNINGRKVSQGRKKFVDLNPEFHKMILLHEMTHSSSDTKDYLYAYNERGTWDYASAQESITQFREAMLRGRMDDTFYYDVIGKKTMRELLITDMEKKMATDIIKIDDMISTKFILNNADNLATIINDIDKKFLSASRRKRYAVGTTSEHINIMRILFAMTGYPAYRINGTIANKR